MFGNGWENEYEVFLTVEADGSVIVREYGGGAENRFSPATFKPAELDQAIIMISGAAQKAGIGLGSAEQSSNYKKKLKADANFLPEWPSTSARD